MKRLLLLIVAAAGTAACALPNATATKAAAVVTGDFSDGEILQVVHTLNNGEILHAETALAKSNNVTVRSAAQTILRDHTASNQEVMAMGIALEASPLSRGLDAQAKELNERLADLSGTEFDCEFLDEQGDLHELALDTVREQLLPDADNARMRTFLTTTATALERHLQAVEHGEHAQAC